jgi:N-acetylmuramoyl-L-alanine amidase
MKDLKGDEDMKTPAKIVVNGKDLQGYILADNLSYAPVRALAEALGAKVGWNDKTKTVTLP